MDEASVCGITHCMRLCENDMDEFTIDPKALGLAAKDSHDLSPEKDIETESKRFCRPVQQQRFECQKKMRFLLNAGLIFLAAGKACDLDEGIEQAAGLLESGAAFETLEKWVKAQNTDPEKGLKRLYSLVP